MKIRSFNILVGIALLTLLRTAVAVDEDDDDILTEIAVDLMIGVAMSVCEQYVACQAVMIITGFITLIIGLMLLCIGEISCADLCTRRHSRRFATRALGYGVGRRLY